MAGGRSDNLPLSASRLWDALTEMARIGATGRGGCDRQALTAADAEARALLARWGREIGLTLSVDRLGNMALRRPGRDPARPPVAFGSHLDTQPTGGRFDGVLGVLAGLELMRAVHEAGVVTEAPLLLVNWANEEGARFSPPMMGSGGAMGLFSEADVLDKRDADGVRFGDALAAIGWNGGAEPAALRDLDAYVELHIEQGPVLEREALEVGVVTHALAQAWYEVTVRGDDAHAGGAMPGRRDALVAAAHMIAAVEDIASAAGGSARGTVGRVLVTPDSRNVVPSKCWFSVDLRHDGEGPLAGMGDALRDRVAAIAAGRGLAGEVSRFWHSPQTPFDAAVVGAVRDAAAANGLRHRDMPTGIGHDAVHAARVVPSAMIFVPCHGGISHNEAESITPAWAEAGLRTLAGAVLALADAPRRGTAG